MAFDVHSVRPDELWKVLSLLFAGLPEPERRDHIQEMLRQVGTGELSTSGLWGAWQESRLCGVALTLLQSDGHVAVWPPVVEPALWTNPAQVLAVATSLLKSAVADWRATGVKLAQCLVERGDEVSPLFLESCGFERMAELVFYECQHPVEALQTRSFESPGAAPRRIEFSESERTGFEEALRQSYLNSLDCPALTRRRTAGDALRSHANAAPIRPEWWSRYETSTGELLGVLLLTQTAPGQPLELAYCGLAPAFRGQGWGRWLVGETLRTAAQHQISKVIVSADLANTPACALYRNCGFLEVDRKLVEMWFLPSE